MGATKNWAFEVYEHELAFHDLLLKLLEAHGYRIDMASRHPGPGFARSGVDFITMDEGIKNLFEAKLYTSPTGIRSTLENACVALSKQKHILEAQEAVLIVSVPLSTTTLQDVQSRYDVTVWDVVKLLSLMRGIPELKRELRSLVLDANIRWDDSNIESLFEITRDDLDVENAASGGTQIIAKLKAAAAGGGQAAAEFETQCEAALRYLFPDDFRGWRRQNRVDGGFHRHDLIARLEPRHEFWKWITRDFRTRFIVFEFKSYSDKLSQDQIYSTEKYLFATALRSVALIVARNGFGDGAMHAVRGALRETGKLMICLDFLKLLEMIEAKDQGNDPTNYLIEIVDNLLMSLGR